MTRPRIKLDGRAGTMRWRSAEGEKRSRGDRLGRMVGLAAEQVIAGTGIDFEVRTVAARGRTKWHPLRMTYAEAEEYLEANWMLRGTLARCLAVRIRRRERGQPVFANADYDRR